MKLTIRPIEAHEASAARALARKSFGPVEGLFIPKPKRALVALVDNNIVGGFAFRIKSAGGKQLGCPDSFFIDPALQGQGVGRQLSDAGFAHMWEQGCDAIATYVRDDNAPSWSTLIQKNGFVRASLPKMLRFLGPLGFLKMFLSTSFGFALGYDYYIALPEPSATQHFEQKKSPWQICAYLLLHLLLFLVLFRRAEHFSTLLAAFGIVFGGNIFAGFLGTLFSPKRKWHFRQPGGGIFICLINLSFNHFFPLCGNWYPARYENTPRFRRDLALSSITAWLFLLALPSARSSSARLFWLLPRKSPSSF